MTALQMSLFSPRWGPLEERKPPPAPYAEPFITAHQATLDAAGDGLIAWDDKRWNHNATDAVGVDVEVYPNFMVVCFKRFSDGMRLAFEKSERIALNTKGVEYVLRKNLTVSFNGLIYDLPIICLALQGADISDLKRASDTIIKSDARTNDIGVRVPRLNHIDLNEPNPAVRQGLKMINGRLHGRYMVDLPYAPETYLTPRQMNYATLYCHNDLDATQLVWEAMREPMDLRCALGREYNLDLRSKSDSQIGETIVKKRVETALNRRIDRPQLAINKLFNYEPPTFLQFAAPTLRALYDELTTTTFSTNGIGKPTIPPALEGRQVKLGNMTYSLGIGGLHSTEAHRGLVSDADYQLIDVDVASQYPNIILNLGLYPPALGPAFLNIYRRLVNERLAAKDAGDKVRADAGRITVNGVYGKLGSPYSVLYAPELVVAVTLTGQLSILMLAERAEAAGIPVVSANTDGVVFRCPRRALSHLDEILSAWEHDTGFKTERTPYKALYSASVNTYLALKEDGTVKRKGGIVADPWIEGDLRGQMMKNPQMTILSRAVVSYLTAGTPLDATIRGCADPRAFITVIKVAGGATWRGHPLGRAVRYYWATGGEPIRYLSNGNKVQKTEGARPLPELTDELPADIDYLRYYEEAARLATELGVRL